MTRKFRESDGQSFCADKTESFASKPLKITVNANLDVINNWYFFRTQLLKGATQSIEGRETHFYIKLGLNPLVVLHALDHGTWLQGSMSQTPKSLHLGAVGMSRNCDLNIDILYDQNQEVVPHHIHI